jgi:hypothetical protein
LAEYPVGLGPSDSLRLVRRYLHDRITGQVRVVVPLVLLLVAFQFLVLGIPTAAVAGITTGIIMVIVGLAAFLEGIRLSIMPLGEEVGIQLPVRAGLLVSIVFGLIVGIGATLAEPAITVLRLLGTSLRPWESPLLYLLLNRYSSLLVLTIGGSVGLAVVFSMLRGYFNWPLKPVILGLIPLVTALSVAAYFVPNLRHITGLAWDTGGVTTGPVTVPLVVSLGIGISRALKREESATSGLGVVTLASLFPVLAIMALGIWFLPSVPEPMGRETFFSAEERDTAISLFESEDDFYRFARSYGIDRPESETGPTDISASPKLSTSRWLREVSGAARSVIPLVAFLVFVLAVLLRRRVPFWDEVALGVVFALVGMTLLNAGIDSGLARLGGTVGGKLPAAFQTVVLEGETRQIPEFDDSLVIESVDDSGKRFPFFYFRDGGDIREIPFVPDRLDRRTGIYRYTPWLGPVFPRPAVGILVVALFAWLTGYMSTIAEPALSVLGTVVEDVTAGTFRRQWLVRIVGLGVGLGMAVGVAKIVFHLPIVWILGPVYSVLFVLTLVSSEEFVNIAWDSAGVTTGPVTVPLVIAIGLGLGSEVGAVEGFGMISLASAFPIMAVLISGIVMGRRKNSSMEGRP